MTKFRKFNKHCSGKSDIRHIALENESYYDRRTNKYIYNNKPSETIVSFFKFYGINCKADINGKGWKFNILVDEDTRDIKLKILKVMAEYEGDIRDFYDKCRYFCVEHYSESSSYRTFEFKFIRNKDIFNQIGE